MKRHFFTCIFLLLLTNFSAEAQSLVDGFSKRKGQLTVVASYTRENYDQFYLAGDKVELSMTGLEQIITQSVNLYAEYGLSDRLDLIVNLPYISSKSKVIDENRTVSAANIQNASLFLEWVAAENEGNAGAVSLLAALGVSAPLSDYATNQIYAIGNQAVSVDPKLVLQYKSVNGIFAHLQGGYSLRTQDVPDAAQLSGKIGYAGAYFYTDAWIAQQWSSGGIDIGSENFTPERFPETKVNTTNIGISVYAPVAKAIGITAGAGKRIFGRNAGLPFWFTAGIALQLGNK